MDESPDGSIDLAPEKRNVTVVGIGASAGGLDAFSLLLKNLGNRSGMAVVLIQHLEPTHASHLADILSKCTSLPVTEVQDGMAVEPDHVYVIPPNTNMALDSGVLHLTPRGELRGLHLPIDFFLRSLAQDKHRRSIGVILSGTGTDGTMGLAEVKAAGGITFAQEVASAKFSGMPASAIAEGSVDMVLTPENIGRELSMVSAHSYFSPTGAEGKEQIFAGCETEFTRIIDLLRVSSGVDFTHYRDTTLKRRILRRMALGKRETLPSYLEQLETDKAEVKALYQDILIHVTRFFRDPNAFMALTETVLPAIWKTKSGDETVRVWVAGCATGEEAYTLAITLCEYQDSQLNRHPLRIFASDISESPSLERARAGLYPENIEHDVSSERLARFFVKEEGGYRIKKEIREICIFAKHDVTADPPFAKLDLISCRNVLIYLSAPLQRRIIPSFHYALNPGGFLLLGNSETIGRDTDLFTEVNSQLRIYSKKMTATRLPFLTSKGKSAEAPSKARSVTRLPATLDFQQAADRLVIRRFSPPGVLVNKDLDILQFRGRTSPYLEPPQGGTGLNLAMMAQESLSQEIRQAVLESGKSGFPVIRKNARIMDGAEIRQVNVEVHPVKLPAAEEACYLILFEEAEDRTAPADPAPARPKRKPVEDEMITVLRSELSASRDYLQYIREQSLAVNEELKASGEEMESSNEELQSTNEELETAKEELQSGNEELATMNDELRTRNLEQAQLNDDLSNLLGSVQISILMLGGDLRLRRFTPSAGKILHLNGTDVGRPVGTLNFFLPELDIEKSVTEVMASQEPSAREIRDREGCWHALRIHPYRSSDGKIDGVVVVLLDIDALKRAQQELQKSGDYTRSIVNTVRDPMLILEEDLRIHSANLSYYRFFGTTPEDTEGTLLQDIPGSLWTRRETLALLSKMASSDTAMGNFEVTHAMPDREVTLVINARRLPPVSGRGNMTLVAIEDVTDRKLAEAALQESQDKLRQSQRMEAIGKLAGGIAHDFNNMLTAINGFSALCLTKAPPEGDMHDYLMEINKAGERAAVLTRQLLAYSRKQILAPMLLDLNGVVTNLHNMLSRLIGVRFQLQLSLQESLYLAKADPGQIEQVLINLVVNARDAMPAGGTITLGTANLDLEWDNPQLHPSVPRGSYAELSIRDTGTGMDVEVLKRLFEPFFTTKEHGLGTGLGLSVVHGIITQSGGHILVNSTLGVGTEFKILLPRGKSGETTALPRPEPFEEPAKRTETVLLVDDEDVIRKFTRRVLELQGYTVLEADSAENAMQINDRNMHIPIHILVTDLIMPGMGGGELADIFVSGRPEGRVLLMSGYTEDSEVLQEGVAKKAYHFIHKPFSPGKFALAVQEALDTEVLPQMR